MITYGAVTVYHQAYDPHGRMDCWSHASYPAVAIQRDTQVAVQQGRMESADAVRIRIPATGRLEIVPGDKVTTGLTEADAPPPDALTVTGVSDNRKGSRRMWHWKVNCT